MGCTYPDLSTKINLIQLKSGDVNWQREENVQECEIYFKIN